MAIDTDISVASNGDIRYTGSGTNYTVIELHRRLGDLMDDAQAAGDDLLDITDATASERSTDNIITLLSPYNIDDTLAQHLYDGSIIQDDGDTIYDGILVFAAAGTPLQIIQNGAPVSPNFWDTGLNADASSGISHRFMLKTRTGGADIDGRRLIGQTRAIGFTYSEFKATTNRGNNVLALTYAGDLNNATSAATIATWTEIDNLTEGYNLIDADASGAGEPYYSEWDKDVYSINQFFERMKWLTRESTVEDSCADTGNNFAVGNGTIVVQAQSFQMGDNDQYIRRCRFQLKKVGAPTGTLTAKVYSHSGTYGVSSIPNALLRSATGVDVATLTTSYLEYEFAFDVISGALLTANTNYVITLEYAAGDASNYVHIEGDTTGTHSGNRASYDGSWTAAAAEDLAFEVYVSPAMYGLPGELFRGITHQITVDAPTGTFSATELVTWSGGTGQMLAVDSVTAGTKMWIQILTGTSPIDNQVITGVLSGATATVNVTITERALSQPFVGASTGSALIGSYGLGVQDSDLTASDKVFDLDNTQRIPPNIVTFTVSGLVIGEDRVLVGPESGGDFDVSQRTLNTTLSGGTETAVVVTAPIPSDTPTTGTIRVQLDSGIYRRLAYTSWAGSTFTIASSDFASDNATAGNDVWISYIDKLARATSEEFEVIYASNRALFVRVRDGGGTPIKTFETTATLGAAGGSASVIRTTDA